MGSKFENILPKGIQKSKELVKMFEYFENMTEWEHTNNDTIFVVKLKIADIVDSIVVGYDTAPGISILYSLDPYNKEYPIGSTFMASELSIARIKLDNIYKDANKVDSVISAFGILDISDIILRRNK